MNYTLRKLNCKALVGGAFAIVLSALFVVSAYASNYTVRKIPSFWFDNKFVFYAENVSPRSSSLDSVIVGYDNLADLVYYCNDHGLSASLYYNSAKNVYVGFLNDTGFKITALSISSVYGLLCNSDGKIYDTGIYLYFGLPRSGKSTYQSRTPLPCMGSGVFARL